MLYHCVSSLFIGIWYAEESRKGRETLTLLDIDLAVVVGWMVNVSVSDNLWIKSRHAFSKSTGAQMSGIIRCFSFFPLNSTLMFVCLFGQRNGSFRFVIFLLKRHIIELPLCLWKWKRFKLQTMCRFRNRVSVFFTKTVNSNGASIDRF